LLQNWRHQSFGGCSTTLLHEAVGRGVAVGIFWAFVIPVGQIIAAVAHCVWWRAKQAHLNLHISIVSKISKLRIFRSFVIKNAAFYIEN
jgi:hypothetical protein